MSNYVSHAEGIQPQASNDLERGAEETAPFGLSAQATTEESRDGNRSDADRLPFSLGLSVKNWGYISCIHLCAYFDYVIIYIYFWPIILILRPLLWLSPSSIALILAGFSNLIRIIKVVSEWYLNKLERASNWFKSRSGKRERPPQEAGSEGEVWIFRLLFTFSRDKRDTLIREFQEAWRGKHPDHTVSIFINHAHKFDWPCCENSSDTYFLKEIGMLYAYCKFDDGLRGLLTPKTLKRVDIVKCHGLYVQSIDSTLRLGYMHHRQVASMYKAAGQKKNEGRDHSNEVVKILKTSGVIRRLENATPMQITGQIAGKISSTDYYALNFVEAWDGPLVMAYILTPTLASVVLCIVWPIVAVKVFDAEVQDSIETATVVATFIVTAGGLLVALLGFYDTIAKEETPPSYEPTGSGTQLASEPDGETAKPSQNGAKTRYTSECGHDP
ncbi:hypothetical protein F5Y16DRAFT_375913 [Xylariaceae sp. FL0255]|nr:hypothetical protein F5Y16DRAFT_375913 [Xylariaceae sp. FL0255]